ncbi:hypothetical protein EUGRSUZ_H05038 [Eucalyptus grandis]|uniref:Uncharacterized protein n=2 Tax=Eucalyptus grandis TaxID=71139 RepID=A0ACC3K0A0_EUCGR|nr:hypothetical protein EUGRSUZ_H05038 [Eucalyptus grandis]
MFGQQLLKPQKQQHQRGWKYRGAGREQRRKDEELFGSSPVQWISGTHQGLHSQGSVRVGCSSSWLGAAAVTGNAGAGRRGAWPCLGWAVVAAVLSHRARVQE